MKSKSEIFNSHKTIIDGKEVLTYGNAIKAMEELENQFCQSAVIPSCEGNCGMNYCDDNGCIERKRNLVEPTDLPEHRA